MASWNPSWLPIRAVGDRVPLGEIHADTVMFLCHRDLDESIQPVGTCFMVSAQASGGGWWRYLVTANHVVRDGGPRWVRFRRVDRSTKDIPTGVWVPHPVCDVAASPVDFDSTDMISLIAESVRTMYFADVWPGEGAQIIRGQNVYFMGLLAHVPTMLDENIPMTRGGCIGALYQRDIPVEDRMPDGTLYTRSEPRAHLIDCYSRAGFSGSPLWVEGPRVVPGTRHLSIDGYAALLGVIVGHFGAPGHNEGVAVAVPVQAIREVLNDARLVAWREGKEAEMGKKRADAVNKKAATLDTAEDRTEYERFEKLTKTLVQTPKPEVDPDRTKDEGSS